ncbi:unnamed protein product, partial [Ixodes hexagonus]
MAPTCTTLSTEFLPGLDWRPLHFEHPLPHERVCQVCGVVCKETFLLPCFHTLCSVCFKGSVTLGCACPLDREVFDQDGVDTLRLRPELLLRQRVSCWNSPHGCNFVGPVSELLGHFEKNCVHHKTFCPRCLQDVPRLGLVQHCVNDCAPTTSAETARPDVTYQGSQLLSNLEKVSAEIKKSIADLKDGYYGLQTSVNTVADDVKLGRSEARQAVSVLMAQLQIRHPNVASPGGQLLGDLKKVSAVMTHSIAELKDVYYGLKTSLNTAADNISSSLLAKLQTTHPNVTYREGQLLEDLETVSVEIKQSIAELKDVASRAEST